MKKYGYNKGNNEHTLFIKKNKFFLMYIDDNYHMMTKNEVIIFKKQLCVEFDLKDLRKLK